MKKYLPVLFLVLVLLGESVATGVLPLSRGWVFNLLDQYSHLIWTAVAVYFVNYLFLDLFQAIKSYAITLVVLLFRTIKTEDVIANVNESYDSVSNVPQRIQEDIKNSYVSRVTVWSEYCVSGAIVIILLVQNISQPILVISAIGYAVISIAISRLFNPKMVKAEKEVQEQEGTFRGFLLQALSLNGLTAANLAEKQAAKVRFHFQLFTKLQLCLLQILPYLVLIPVFFAGTITLGDLIKFQAAFTLIVINAAILIQLYPTWIKGKASAERVEKLSKKREKEVDTI